MRRYAGEDHCCELAQQVKAMKKMCNKIQNRIRSSKNFHEIDAERRRREHEKLSNELTDLQKQNKLLEIDIKNVITFFLCVCVCVLFCFTGNDFWI